MSDLQRLTQFPCLTEKDQQVLQAYALYVQRKNMPPTCRSKLKQLHGFFHQLPLPQPLQLAQITADHIDTFIQRAQQRGLTAATINGYLSTLRDCFHFLQEEDYLLHNPVKPHRHYLRVPRHLPRPMERDDVRKLLDSLRSIRDRALCSVALYCGLRASEVTHLKVADLDWERHTLRVNQGKGHVDRLVYLTAPVEESLRAWLSVRASGNDYVFCSRRSRPHRDRPMSTCQLRVLIKQWLRNAGIDPTKYSFHTLRHTFATELINAGISLRSLQELLGHKSLREVLIYAQLYESTKRQEFYCAMATLQAVPPLVTGGGE